MPKIESKKRMYEKGTRKSIDQKIADFDEGVEWFYSDDFSLDQALVKYQAVYDLAEEIKQDLLELKNKVEIVDDFSRE